MSYVGRFAPSPTGLLHTGSLVAALASWLDARAHRGTWLIRIEDLDRPRCVPGADRAILHQLAACGLEPDAPPLYQSTRAPVYAAALERLLAEGWAYPCGCSRANVEAALAATGCAPVRGAELVYPGTCRDGLHGRHARATRVRAAAALARPAPLTLDWSDRRLGARRQAVDRCVGDFVLQRADGLHAYQLAVVVDDADQGVTDIVRGADLADNTPRQIHLQRLLDLPTPRYLHTPLVTGVDGEKLSKQNGAAPIGEPSGALREAGGVLGIASDHENDTDWRSAAVAQWHSRWLAGATLA